MKQTPWSHINNSLPDTFKRVVDALAFGCIFFTVSDRNKKNCSVNRWLKRNKTKEIKKGKGKKCPPPSAWGFSMNTNKADRNCKWWARMINHSSNAPQRVKYRIMHLSPHNFCKFSMEAIYSSVRWSQDCFLIFLFTLPTVKYYQKLIIQACFELQVGSLAFICITK